MVWSITENPTTAKYNGITDDGKSAGEFTSELSGLAPGTTYYIRAYAVAGQETLYGEQLEFTTKSEFATVATGEVTGITRTSALIDGKVEDESGYEILSRGVVWGMKPSPTVVRNEGITVEDGSTSGFTSVLTDLEPGAVYYARAYARNIRGADYGEEVKFRTGFRCGDNFYFTYRGELVVYGSVEGQNGTCWFDRNLGASRVATSYDDDEAFGDRFQWGRGDDGHQLRWSQSTTNLSSTKRPGHDRFIHVYEEPWDWLYYPDDELWQGDGGFNDPCPAGWRLPTEQEMENELLGWDSNNEHVPFSSSLKLVESRSRPIRGGRHGGEYWTSSTSGIFAKKLFIHEGGGHIINSHRYRGLSVRCIRDE